MKKENVPQFFYRFFRWFCKPELFEELQGDMEEAFQENKATHGHGKASRIYRLEVLKMLRPSVMRFFRIPEVYNPFILLRNYYVAATRNLLKHKSYFVINISGLAIGLTSFIFIALYIINELSYDRFHSNYENIYRVGNMAVIRGEVNDDATTGAPLAQTMLDNYPEVTGATRVKRDGSLLIGDGNSKIDEDGVLYAEASFFEVFDFELIKGNPKTALVQPRSMILTESYALKYFGNEDPIGKQLTVEEDSIFYSVTGVVRDIPANSHIQFDILASLSTTPYDRSKRWIGTDLHTYVVLKPETSRVELQEKMQEIFYKHVAPEIEFYTGLEIAEWEGAGNSVSFKLTPLEDIHLRSESGEELEPTGNITYIYTHGLIGLIILLIAIFNFVNLATAYSTRRAKEVGIRKVIGSTRLNLIHQFIVESVLVSLLASVFATIMIILLKPYFIQLVGKELAVGLTSGYQAIPGLVGLAVVVGVIAGCYPAFVLSTFRPAEVLKGTMRSGLKTGWLRNMLVTMQFAASIVIITGTILIYHQIDFMLSKNLGFDKDQILVLKRPDWLGNNLEVFKNEVLTNSNIKVASNSETIPGKRYDIRSYRRKNNPETFLFLNNQVSYEYLELMGLELLSGRIFSKEYKNDSNAVVINEAAARAFGFDDPIGQQLTSAFKKGRTLTIIGMIKDYNTESLHKAIAPVSLELDQTADTYVSIKLSTGENIRETLQFVEDSWHKHSNGKPLQYFFFNQEYENIYRSETTTGQLMMVFATLSIFIACMGLIGLTTYTASVRQKEIGIRKVLGAGVATLIRLLSSDLIRLLIIATLISWPLAFFASDYWLQNFTHRIDINPWYYVIATLLVIIIGGVTISLQTIKASTSNPVNLLRQE